MTTTPSADGMAAARRPAASIFAQPAALAPAERQVRRHALARLGVSWLVMMQVMMLAWPGYLRGQAMPDDAAFTLDRAIVLMNWASLVLTVPVVLYCAWPLWRGAWASLRQARAGMDVPVALGIVGAFLPSAWATWRQAGEVYFDSVTMFVAFLLAARYLELCARQRVGGADAAALGAALDSGALAQRADRVAARFVTLQVLLALLAGAGWGLGRARARGARDGGFAGDELSVCHGHGGAGHAGRGTGRAVAGRTRRRCRRAARHSPAGAAHRPAESVWLVDLAPPDGAARAGGLGHALAGGARHAAVHRRGGAQRLAPGAPPRAAGVGPRGAGLLRRAMDILYLLLPVSLIFVLAIGVALWWAVFNGQFDDSENEGLSILRDKDV